jgi:hypothetical protein
VNSWQSFGWPLNAVELTCPRIGNNFDGSLQVFSLGNDGNLWTIAQTAPSNGWGSWQNLSHPSGLSICCLAWGREAYGQQDIYALANTGEIVMRQQIDRTDSWGNWKTMSRPLGVLLHNPLLNENLDGRLEVFSIGDDGNLWHRYQVVINDGWSANWESLGKPANSALWQFGLTGFRSCCPDSKMEVFGQSYLGEVWHIGQTRANNGWGDWASLGSPPGGISGDMTIGRNSSGQLVLFAVGSDGAIWQNPAGASLFLPIVLR